MISLAHYGFYCRVQLCKLDTQAGEHLGGEAVTRAGQAEQYMLGAHVVVIEALRLLLGELQRLPGPFRECVEGASGRLGRMFLRGGYAPPDASQQAVHGYSLP